MANFHVEIELLQNMHHKENVCGDMFQANNEKEDGRRIIVLSDGMGHGVKANVLASLTSTMALKYAQLQAKPELAAEIIMSALPKTADKKDSYATFTVIEIENDGRVTIVNYDNPPVVIMRDKSFLNVKTTEKQIRGKGNEDKKITYQEFKARKEDRLIFFSDGVPQSGLGKKMGSWGWGEERINAFIASQVEHSPDISANKLGRKLLNQSIMNDGYTPEDDISCGVIYFRQPREILVVTGPPFYKGRDRDFVMRVRDFDGKKIVCGGTTSEIIARELDLEIKAEQQLADPFLPPQWSMKGFELVTEGILTIGKVEEILENYSTDTRLQDSPAEEVVKQLLDHDVIYLLVGTRINWAHQDPDQPVELEIRKFVVKRVVRLLEEKFFKEVKVEFV